MGAESPVLVFLGGLGVEENLLHIHTGVLGPPASAVIDTPLQRINQPINHRLPAPLRDLPTSAFRFIRELVPA